MTNEFTGWRRLYLPFLLTWVALALLLAVGAAMVRNTYPVPLWTALCLYACCVLLLGLFLLPGFDGPRRRVAALLTTPQAAGLCVLLFLLPYAIYVVGTLDFRWQALAKLAALATVPFGLYSFAPPADPKRFHRQDLVAMVWLVTPVLCGWLRGIWNVPVNLDFLTRLFLGALGAWVFLVLRTTEGDGYQYRFTLATLRDALLNFGGFALAALPIGWALGFIGWNPHWRGPAAFLFDYAGIFLFIALLEELLFRALLQNWLEATWNSRYKAQAVASVLFGLTHILHKPVPNWRYVILASVAGWFYGTAWRRKRSLMASATTHALVDTIWRTWFLRPPG